MYQDLFHQENIVAAYEIVTDLTLFLIFKIQEVHSIEISLAQNRFAKKN